MAERTIRLTPDAATSAVLGTARSVLEARGYLWVPERAGRARAHQGGREITSGLMARRLVLSLAVADRRLVLRRESSGWGWALALGALMAMRINREFGRVRHRLRSALRNEGLAA